MRFEPRSLEDQTIVITGASSGIGLTTARMAAQRGARVVLASRDEADLDEAVRSIRDAGGQATSVVADVADLEQVRTIAQTALRDFGSIDTWVNNAGVSIFGRVEEVSVEDARRLFDTNYWGVVNGSLVAIEHLHQRGGVLINIGSVVSDRAIPLQGHYSASKHAVKGFSDALRVELEESGAPIAVTLIKPTSIDTPYPQHAKNYMDEEPSFPPPVYAPEVVARAILHCAEDPEREVLVGGGAKLISVMGGAAPELTDRYMRATMFDQQTTGQPSPAGRRDSLWSPHPGDAGPRGHYEGRVMQHSAYTAAVLHPVIALLATVGAALAIGTAASLLARRG